MKIGSVLYYGGGGLCILATMLVWTAGPGVLLLSLVGFVCAWVGYYYRGRGM